MATANILHENGVGSRLAMAIPPINSHTDVEGSEDAPGHAVCAEGASQLTSDESGGGGGSCGG